MWSCWGVLVEYEWGHFAFSCRRFFNMTAMQRGQKSVYHRHYGKFQSRTNLRTSASVGMSKISEPIEWNWPDELYPCFAASHYLASLTFSFFSFSFSVFLLFSPSHFFLHAFYLFVCLFLGLAKACYSAWPRYGKTHHGSVQSLQKVMNSILFKNDLNAE